jgi:hypothetical protein
MRAKFINEKFTERSNPIKDMGIGIDYNTIEGFLKTSGYKDIDVEHRRHTQLPRTLVEFSKGNIKFSFEIVLDDDAASWRHCLEWRDKTNDRSFDYQEPRWTSGDDRGEIDDEKFIVSILRRRLNKYNKTHS